ncbi:hypothetical protein VTO42DRAFT_1811 [Malbranchea cinnamomea]
MTYAFLDVILEKLRSRPLPSEDDRGGGHVRRLQYEEEWIDCLVNHRVAEKESLERAFCATCRVRESCATTLTKGNFKDGEELPVLLPHSQEVPCHRS